MMKTNQILIGCGIATLVAVVVLFTAAYLGAAAFFRYGVGSDLSDYRDAIQRMNIDSEAKKRILSDLEKVRLSLDDRNRFGFFQWIEIDESVQGIIADGKIEGSEYDSLLSEISRMKKIQGIEKDGAMKEQTVLPKFSL